MGVVVISALIVHARRMSMPNRIAALRKSSGLSQSKLAEAIGATLSMVGKLERGERELTTRWMLKISKALGCKPADLLHADNVFIEFGIVDSRGAIIETPVSELAPDFAGLGMLVNRADEYKTIDGEEVAIQRGRSATLAAPLNLAIPEGSRLLFSWTEATSVPDIGKLSVIGVRHGETYSVVVGLVYPGTEIGRHHVLPVGGTLISNAEIDTVVPIDSIILA